MEVKSQGISCRGCQYAPQSARSAYSSGAGGRRNIKELYSLTIFTRQGQSASLRWQTPKLQGPWVGKDRRSQHARRQIMPCGASIEQRPEGDSGQSLDDSAGTDVGVVVVDHGSKRAEANAMLEEFVRSYKARTGRAVVEVAHMEIASPSIADAVGRCVAAGSRRVVVAPYFLSRGRHIQTDIPALVAEAAAQHPGVVCTVADPIGIDPLLVDIIDQRVKNALGEGLSHSAGH